MESLGSATVRATRKIESMRPSRDKWEQPYIHSSWLSWRTSTTRYLLKGQHRGHKQFKRFLECTDGNYFLQGIEE